MASSVGASSAISVEESGKGGDRALEVPRSVSAVLIERLGAPHVGSELGVGGEHGHVLRRGGALQCKVVGQLQPSVVKAVKLKGEQGRLIAGVASPQDNCKCFLLDGFNLSGLFFSEATIKHWSSKLKGGAHPGLVYFHQLLSRTTKQLKSDKHP